MSFADAWAAAGGVEGWLTEAQARRLYAAAAVVPARGRIVEIGSFRGRSAIVLARAARTDVDVACIDPHVGSDRGPGEIAARPALGEADLAAFRRNLERAGVLERVRHLRHPRRWRSTRSRGRSTCSTSTARTGSGRLARTSCAGARACPTAGGCSSMTRSRRSA